MSEHTPTPWTFRIWKDGDELQANRIEDRTGFEIASLSYTGGPEDEDAEFICRAVNSHEALVRALQEVCNWILAHDGTEEYTRAMLPALREIAGTALAKAEGKE